MKNSTTKYFNVLQFISEQKSFHSKTTLRQFKISNNFLTAGKDMGLFQRINESEYVWNLKRAPMVKDAHEIQLRIRAASTSARLKAKGQPKNQLKLQPIKRIERVAPMPVRVQEEPIHDTSNSKVIIILAVGAMVGFLIATIIWK